MLVLVLVQAVPFGVPLASMTYVEGVLPLLPRRCVL